MYTLISFATQWGSNLGGINSFNTDLLSAFGVAYHLSAQVICIVTKATKEEIDEAGNSHVCLVELPYVPQDKSFTAAHAKAGIDELKSRGITFDPAQTIWLGHDRISGAAANEAARIAGGRSALIHHMSYDHYESYAEDSKTAYEKKQTQQALFRQADLVLAVGPLLRDALSDLLGESKQVHMLIPGLAEIDLRPAPKTFTAFLSGRLSENAAKIKQGHLGIAAFAQAHREARDRGMPDGLCNQPKLVLRGVDFEDQLVHALSPSRENPETELKKFAEQYADAVINLHALPYTQNRQMLYSDLSAASVALMPSWHEGFGLVAWEAIAAGVPLIVSKNSGVYRFLEETFPGRGTGCVYPVDVRGSVSSPFFHQDDLQAVTAALTAIANKPGEARRKAGQLRDMLGSYTWSACAEQTAQALQWPIPKGSIPPNLPEPATIRKTSPVIAAVPQVSASASPLQIPAKQWQTGSGMADSQLLRAEEAQVPFDPARQPELIDLHNWLDDPRWPQTVRLTTGAGGLGKTRLALELCQQRLAQGWHAGFLDNDCNASNIAIAWQALRDRAQPLLIVIDYAETRQTVLLALVKVILLNPADQPVRILLLARDGGEWWDNLPGKDPQCEALLSGYATSGPFCLPPLYLAAHDRSQAYQQALRAFAQTLKVPAPDVVPELSGEHFGRPLYLQMAALMALHGERPTTAEGLTRALLNHERRYWRGLLSHTYLIEPERHAQQLLALATLAGGFATPRDAQPYWTNASDGSLSPAEFSALFYALVPLYPGRQGLQAVRPDLLGEALVGQSLLRPEASGILDAFLTSAAGQPVRRHALTLLARLSSQRLDLDETLTDAFVRHFAHCYQDIVTVATETTGRLPILAEAAFIRLPLGAKSQLAGVLSPLLKEESVQLATLACSVTAYLVEKSRQKLRKKKTNIDCLAAYASALMNHSVTLVRAGRNEQALSSSHESLRFFKQLNDKNRRRFEPGYAMSLSNYANRLSDIGQNEEALNYDRQTLEIYQRLAQKNPDRFEPDYARSLNNYANRLSDAGKNEEALTFARQALEIRRRLATKHPARYEVELFTSTCHYHFLSWLSHPAEKSGDLAELTAMPTTCPRHRLPLLQLYSKFVQGCWTPDPTIRALACKEVISTWGDLSSADKNNAQSYWLCAAAWCAVFAPEAIVGIDWQASWHQFAAQRHGRLPHWMQEFAQRFSFQWPAETKLTS